MRKREYPFVERILLSLLLGMALFLCACSPAAMQAPALTLAPTEAPAPASTPAPVAEPAQDAQAAAEQDMCLMPDLLWETADFAVELIAACNPDVAIEYQESQDVPSGLIAGQSLAVGEKIESGNCITLTVSVPAPTAKPARKDQEGEKPAVEAGPTPEPTPYVTALGLVQNPDGTFSDPYFIFDDSDSGATASCG